MKIPMPDDITVTVKASYLDSDSRPEKDLYVFGYTVTIRNLGSVPVQLTDRHWTITDSMGRTRSISGEGVVGQKPVLAPGETFEYSSGAPLFEPSGIMMGRYTMQTLEGESFDVPIPAFSLDSPHHLIRPN